LRTENKPKTRQKSNKSAGKSFNSGRETSMISGKTRREAFTPATPQMGDGNGDPSLTANGPGKWQVGGGGQPVSSFDGHFDGFASNQLEHGHGPHKGSGEAKHGAGQSMCIRIFSAPRQMYLHVLCRHLLAIFILALRIGRGSCHNKMEKPLKSSPAQSESL